MPRRSRIIAALFCASALALVEAAAAAPAPRPPLSAANEALREQIRQLLAGDAAPVVAGQTLDGASLLRLYEARSFEPIWQGDRLTTLTSVLAEAADHGIELAVPSAILAGSGHGAVSAAERDLYLSQVALGYATALAVGRVRPENFETDWAVPAPNFDPVTGLARAVASGSLPKWFAGLPPQNIAYFRLKAALSRYRTIAKEGGWPRIGKGPTIKVGMTDDRVDAVRRRLLVEGDLVGDAEGDNTFTQELSDAVSRFQERHGIVPDGAVGPRTLATMNIPASARVEQIALTLERWRSLPRDFGKSYMLVNVPAATLDIVEDGEPVMAMKVVVGDPDHPTPVIQTSMVGVTFNPPWNIPSSIVTKEIMPKVKKDPAYLKKNDMAYIQGHGLVQLPGPKNPLGQIKFETPNRFDVYLHDTPSKKTFERVARAQSHGCVRVEKAHDLADFVLRQLAWQPEQVEAAVAANETQRVELKHRWRVHLMYWTSFVDADGTVEFRDDVYGRDKRLHEALAALPKGAPAVAATKNAIKVGLNER